VLETFPGWSIKSYQGSASKSCARGACGVGRTLNPIVREFTKCVQDIEASYRSVRIRALLARSGGRYVPCVTEIELLPTDPVVAERKLWKSSSLRVIEQTIAYEGIDSLIHQVYSSSLTIQGTPIGFESNDAPYWYYNVISRDERRGDFSPESKTLHLRGSTDREKLDTADMNRIQREIELHTRLPFQSLLALTRKFFRFYHNGALNSNVIDIIAPSCVRLIDLTHVGQEVIVRFTCRREVLDRVEIKATFLLPNRELCLFSPRLRNPNPTDLPDGSVEVLKRFSVPEEARNAVGVDVTLALGKLGIDSMYAHNVPLVNPLWSVLGHLSKSRFGKYFELDSFETTIRSKTKADVFEDIVSILLTCCGFQVAHLASFKLSSRDFIAWDARRNRVLVCECTTGGPRDKIGPMKGTVADLRARMRWLTFVGVVFTSQSISKVDRESASADDVIVMDVSDLKHLATIAQEQPSREKVYEWLGIN